MSDADPGLSRACVRWPVLPVTALMACLSCLICLICLISGACAGTAADRYEVRGLVESVDGTGDGTRVTVHHEAIPAFKGRDGTATGMHAMKMAFGVSPTVDRSLLVRGAKVTMAIEVNWRRRPVILITRAAALPADTPLDLAP